MGLEGIISVSDSQNADVKFIFFLRHNDWNVFAKNEVCNISCLGVILKKAAGGLHKMN